METYPVDIDPGQIVRWVMVEQQTTPSPLRTVARRTTEVRDIAVRSDYHLGDEEREDLSEVATIATLEITPAHPDEGWRLTVVVEDEIGPRVTPVAGEQTIDLNTFYKRFIRSGRGIASVTAQVDGPAGEAHMSRLLESIEKDRHGASRSKG